MKQYYINLPANYINFLKQNKKREKARAFMEYFSDMHDDEVNSITFYAQSWGTKDKPKNRGSVQRWITEFKDEISKFFIFWELKNTQHYSSVKNQMQHQCNTKTTNNTQQSTNNKDFKETNATPMQHQCNKDLNINTTTKTQNSDFASDGEFNVVYSELRFVAKKWLGGKDNAYKSYEKVKAYLNIKIVAKAYKAYAADLKDSENIVGLSTFLDNEIYLTYLPKEIKIKNDEEEIIGSYADEVLTTKDKAFTFSVSKYLEKLKANEIIFLGVK